MRERASGCFGQPTQRKFLAASGLLAVSGVLPIRGITVMSHETDIQPHSSHRVVDPLLWVCHVT